MTWARPPARVKQYEGANPSAPRVAIGRMPITETTVQPLMTRSAESIRSEPYRRWVASLDCAHCGRAGPSQCAHADEGKGLGLKAPDWETYPLCADQPGRVGCHHLIGATGIFRRDQRRALEARYTERTREQAKNAGTWPAKWFNLEKAT